MANALNRLKGTKGATKVEYAFLLSLLAFTIIPISQLSGSMGSVFTAAGCAGASSCSPGITAMSGMSDAGGGSEATNPDSVLTHDRLGTDDSVHINSSAAGGSGIVGTDNELRLSE